MSLKMRMTETGGFDLKEPDEWLAGVILGIEEREGQYGPGIKFIIELDNAGEDELPTWAICSQRLSTKSKLYKWLAGLDPTNLPEPGDAVDLNKFVDRRVEVMFEHYEEDGLTRQKVSKLRAEKKATDLQKKQAAASKAKTVAPDEEPF
jgi:hypothetical protein